MTSSHENLHGFLRASGAELVDFIGVRNVPEKKVANYNRTHILCPVHFSVILAIFETGASNCVEIVCLKDAFPISLAH